MFMFRYSIEEKKHKQRVNNPGRIFKYIWDNFSNKKNNV